MNVTKCDGCHEDKELHLFKNIVDSGFMAYCWPCAVKWGKFSGTSKKQMIDNEITANRAERKALEDEWCYLAEDIQKKQNRRCERHRRDGWVLILLIGRHYKSRCNLSLKIVRASPPDV